jgi:hypothetical protein
VKKAICLIAAVLVPALLLSSCFAGNTTTDYARNHVYRLGDVIRFYDETKDRELLGILTFVAVHVLSEDEFTLQEEDGTDEKGKTAYKDVTYRQVVQIDYAYQSITGKRANKFHVRDAAGGTGVLNPDTPYTTKPVEPGVSSLVAALPARGKSVRVEVFFTGVFAPNAVASLAVGKDAAPPTATEPTAPPVTTAAQTQNDTQQEIALLEARLDEQRQSILVLDAQLDKKQGQNTVLVILLTTVSSVLLMLLWQQLRNRRRP